MAKTSIFLSTASRELSAIYSSYGAKLPFGWWRISGAYYPDLPVFCRIGGNIFLFFSRPFSNPVYPFGNSHDLFCILAFVRHPAERGTLLLYPGAAPLPPSADRPGDLAFCPGPDALCIRAGRRRRRSRRSGDLDSGKYFHQ